MKKVLISISLLLVSKLGFSQNEQSKNIPSIKILPKNGEVKQIYELPAKTEYKIYNAAGKLVTEGNDQFIDYTKYKKGTYFILFNGRKEIFEK